MYRQSEKIIPPWHFQDLDEIVKRDIEYDYPSLKENEAKGEFD